MRADRVVERGSLENLVLVLKILRLFETICQNIARTVFREEGILKARAKIEVGGEKKLLLLWFITHPPQS